MIYTLIEVTEILKCSYSTIYKLVKDGTIKSFRVGADYRIKEEDLNEYINRGR